MAGQGCISETLSLSELTGFNVGGTIHLVINNQIGFTTEARDGRSSRYCTDVSKLLGIPVIHVNGQSVDHVLLVSDATLARKLFCQMRYRSFFLFHSGLPASRGVPPSVSSGRDG